MHDCDDLAIACYKSLVCETDMQVMQMKVQRLLASLAFSVWEVDTAQGLDAPESHVPELFALLQAVDQSVHLVPEDVLHAMVVLSRMPAASRFASSCAGLRARQEPYVWLADKLVALLYLSQVQLYDDPISKHVWLRFLPHHTWHSFLAVVMHIVEACKYETMVGVEDMSATSVYIEQTIAPRATNLYLAVHNAEQAAAAARQARATMPVPSESSELVGDADHASIDVSCHEALPPSWNPMQHHQLCDTGVVPFF